MFKFFAVYIPCVITGTDWDHDEAVWRIAIPPDDSYKGLDFYFLSMLEWR